MREEWKQKIGVYELHKQLEIKIAHHHNRYASWCATEKNVMETIKADGIAVKESAQAGYSNAVYGPQVVIDPTLQRDLTECHQKKEEHLRKENEYRRWQEFLELAGPDILEITYPDYLYFYGDK